MYNTTLVIEEEGPPTITAVCVVGSAFSSFVASAFRGFALGLLWGFLSIRHDGVLRFFPFLHWFFFSVTAHTNPPTHLSIHPSIQVGLRHIGSD